MTGRYAAGLRIVNIYFHIDKHEYRGLSSGAMTLAEYLDWKALTGQQFAELAGLDMATVSRLKNGQGKRPSGATVEKVERATRGKVTLADLVDGRAA